MWDLLLKIAIGALAAYGAYKIYTAITADEVRKTARQKVPNAFKVHIKEAKRNAVKVGVFDRNNNELGELEIESDSGVQVRQGQVIYC